MREIPESYDTIAAHIAAPLKTSERAEATFADRVMQGVRAEARAESTRRSSRSWWRRPVTLHVSPLAGLALAAGLAAVMLAGADLLSKRDRSVGAPHSVAARPDTVHVVRFVFVAPGAATVAIVGDFNHWDVNAHRLSPAGASGVWSVSVPLTLGRHEYAFVIDGTRWVTDPAAAATIADEFGGQSSVVTVGGPARPRSS
jgi:Carbohydrate-binding module 48 (Isoamylase N-terminal domain)